MANANQNTVDEINRSADSVKERAEKTAARAKGTVSEYAGAASETVSDLTDRGRDYARDASRAVGRYADEAEAMTRRNPLAAIATALLAGLVIGYLSRGR